MQQERSKWGITEGDANRPHVPLASAATQVGCSCQDRQSDELADAGATMAAQAGRFR